MNPSRKLPSGLDDFACQLADAAGEKILPYFRSNLVIDLKPDETPVTAADREAEVTMRQLINQYYPNHGIFGEEYGLENSDSEFLWVLDPIDGTRAFVAGKPIFGTLIALLQDGIPIIGIIDQPFLKERWIGISGTNTTLNGNPVSTRDCPAISDAILNATSPDMFDDISGARFQTLSNMCQSTQYGGDCYGYALLASGFIDLVVESDLKPYDFCALIPVIEGAGGRICDWDGDVLNLQSSGHIIAAGNPDLADAVSDILSVKS
jgi:inositol-phosphate phosphatase/L-galactose 1-phosphate phosphatase/histidinol-phosphatase